MEDIFQNAPADRTFWVCDGRVLHNLFDLANAFKDMKDSTFKYHANKQKNDFSEWVKNILNNLELANELARTITKDKAELIVLRYIIKKLTPK